MTPLAVSIVAAIASVGLLLVVLDLIRRRKLRERYALLWLATGVVLLVLSLWRSGLNTIADWFGVTGYPPAVLFAVAVLFILLVLLDYSTVISKLSDQNTVLAQRIGLLEQRLRERYALLWLATGIVLLVLSLWRSGLNTIAGWLGVKGYPPAVLFAVATLFILLVLLDYSTVISKLADQNTILAQRLAILEAKLRERP